MRIKQGDAYNIDITLETDTGEKVTDLNAAVVEVALGGIVKTFPGDLIPEREVEWPGYGFSWERAGGGFYLMASERDEEPLVETGSATFVSGELGPNVPFTMFSVGDMVDIAAVVNVSSDPAYHYLDTWSIENTEVLAVGTREDGDYYISFDYPAPPEPEPGHLPVDIADGSDFRELTIKKHGAGEYSGTYVFPLSQEETFKMDGVRPIEARVKFLDDTVVGASVGVLWVEPSLSKEVL